VNCAPELKLRGGWTKWILREALKGTLPEAIRQRKSKLGFETPQGQWLREDVGRTIRSLTEQSAFRAERILSLNRVHKQLALFLSGGPGALDELEAFRVLSLELWSRVFGVS
jgi:asparagine synthase (glutamine-hydrolysing)